MARPLKYTEQEFANKVDEYFDRDWSIAVALPSKAGLLLHLDISKETWREYKERKEFVDPIKRAELFIEVAWVNRLTSNAPTGAIFYLKNAFKEDYRDRHETDITSGDKPIPLLNGIYHNESDKKTGEAQEEN